MKYPKWNIFGKGKIGSLYGEVLQKRATGELPEMQSSIAAAKRLAGVVREGDRIADVGAGPGHYLISLRKTIKVPFRYTGIDGTHEYVERGKQSFPEEDFRYGNIFDLPFADKSFDVVMCNNVLLHLPSIEKPISELLRIAKRFVLIRTLVGESTFLIKEVRPPEEYRSGDPVSFNFFNIYSENRVRNAVEACGAKAVIEPDRDFVESAVAADVKVHGLETNITRIVNGMQVRDYIIQPYCFISVHV